MPPKIKDTVKKAPPSLVRKAISDSSLVYVPEDTVEGFEERIETGIDWTLLEKGVRHHKHLCKRDKIPTVTFSQALQHKLSKSVLNGFLDGNSGLNINQQWEFMLPATLWDNEKFANDERKICFHNANCVTDDLVKLIKRTVKVGDRNVLKEDIKMVNVLRVNDSQMTELDEGLFEFKKLVSLNLCGNFIAHLDTTVIPPSLKSLELQANRISNLGGFAESLPYDLLYLGLAKNFISSDNIQSLGLLPYNLTVLDLSDNDIYDLESVVQAVAKLPYLTALQLAGNPCSVCAAYARLTLTKLQRLRWLDCREVLQSDRPAEPIETHPDDLRSTYFNFTVIRIMSVPQPPKAEKGAITSFHVELEIPLLDVVRRRFLWYRRNESLIDMLPPPEDEDFVPTTLPSHSQPRMSKIVVDVIDEAESEDTDIYNQMVAKNPREIHNFTTFESNRVQWNKVMNFTEPVVKLFCPDLFALRDTFRSVLTVKLVYSITYMPTKIGKGDRKSSHVLKAPAEMRVVMATMKLSLKNLDWSQPTQHFHWDDTLGTEDAIHWGDGDLSVIQYSQLPVKTPKGKLDGNEIGSRQISPENLTCHFSVGIDTLRHQ